jgi:acyl-CoA synthetase (AMP-forming)/AMP-acid ligase II
VQYAAARLGAILVNINPAYRAHELRYVLNQAGVSVLVATESRREDDLARRVSTVGTALPHVEVKIVDSSTGLTVPRGEPGEFCTRGYSVMLGYWDMPERTAEAVDSARWMHTGDLAVMDADGYVNIVGRIKDLVIPGRREHLPAGDRGVPAHPPGHRGRAGDRRAGRRTTARR